VPRTLLVSDLHLGAYSHGDVARRPELRAPLMEAVRRADRVVLLGDVLELRDGPVRRAMAAARPFFEDLAQAAGDRQVVLVPGNHDYELVAPWLERRRDGGDGSPLRLEEWASATEASEEAATIATWMPRADVRVAYPGLWLREDVYGHHGHYADRHVSVPSFERIGARLIDRVVRGGVEELPGPEGYEAALSPVYALLHAVAQYAPEEGTGGSGASARAYRILVGDGGPRRVRDFAIGALGWPALVATLNRAGLGPVKADLSGYQLRRSMLDAMGEVLQRLSITAEYVVFGHFHRGGPFEDRDDDPEEWTTPAGTRLVNSGCWLWGELFMTPTPGESPYWPGVAVWVEDQGPPRLERLLADRRHEELRPGVVSRPRPG
jgi:hypothetical protein